jgi:hypothetical protein
MAEHGAARVSRRDLIAVGYRPAQIDRWVAGGLFVRDGRGELRIPGSVGDLHQELAGMVWRAGRDARVAGALRCALAGLPGFPTSTRDYIAVPPTRRVRGVDFPVVQTPVPAEDEDRVFDLPAVTVARGLIGAAATYHPARIKLAHDYALHHRLVKRGEVMARAHDLGNVHGAPQMRRIGTSGALETESPRERRLLGIFRAGDPKPHTQVWVCWNGKWFRLDFAYLEARLALEYDGGSHDDTREADADRDMALAELTIQPLRITKGMMRDPAATRRRILAVRTSRMALGLSPLVSSPPPWEAGAPSPDPQQRG